MRKPSPSTPKALSMSALLPMARFTAYLGPAKNPFSSIPKQNTSGIWHSGQTGLSTSPPETKDRSSPSRQMARVNFSTPATKLTFAFWLSTPKEISLPAQNLAGAFCASRRVPQGYNPLPYPGIERRVPQGLPVKTPRILPRQKPKVSCSTKLPSVKSLLWPWPPMASSTSRRLARSSAPDKLPAPSSLHRKARRRLPPAA